MSDALDGARLPAIPVAIEVTDAGTRLSALIGEGASPRRVQERLSLPLRPDEAHDGIAEFVFRALQDTEGHAGAGRSQQPPISLAVALAGQVHQASGTVLQADGLPEWSNLALGHRLRQRFPFVSIESAINAAALAESAKGAGAAFASAFYVSLGRRVRAAFVVDGIVIRGAHDSAGQLGHWRVSEDGPRCVCGAAGHLDPIASAQSIVRNMIGLASASEESHAAMLRVAHGRAEAISSAQVLELAGEGDPAAQAVTNAAIDSLSATIANVVAVLDPGGVVVDGPFGQELERLLSRIRAGVHRLTAPFAAPITIVASHFGARGVLEGARLIAEQAADGHGHAG